MSEEVLGRYQLKVHWIDVYANYVVTINGFPARERWVKAHTVRNEFDVPLETGLVRGKNEVEVRLRPRLRRYGEKLEVEGVNFEARLMPFRGAAKATEVMTRMEVDSTYRAWKKRVQARWSDYRGELSLKEAFDSTRTWAHRHPMTVTATFDNEHGPDFSRVFEEAPVLEDTPATRRRLKDYAMRLRDLMAQRDTLRLYQEAKLMFADHETGKLPSKKEGIEIIADNWLTKEWRLDFAAEDVGVRRWSGGRVWELYKRSRGNELFVAGRERAVGMLDIYVAEIDGELKVVR